MMARAMTIPPFSGLIKRQRADQTGFDLIGRPGAPPAGAFGFTNIRSRVSP